MWRYRHDYLINNSWLDNRVSCGELVLYKESDGLHIGIVDKARRLKGVIGS